MPLKQYHFDLTKSEFRDGSALRFEWNPVKMPSLCARNGNFTLANNLHFLRGGLTHKRQNELRNSIAKLLTDVCHDVKIEIHLPPLQAKTFALKSTTTDNDSR